MEYSKMHFNYLFFSLLLINFFASANEAINVSIDELSQIEIKSIEKSNVPLDAYQILSVDYKKHNIREKIIADRIGVKPNIIYADEISCDGVIYPTILFENQYDNPVNKISISHLKIYDQQLKKIKNFSTSKSLRISADGQYAELLKQPMFERNNIEKFVCANIEPLCENDESIIAQCSLHNGKKAYICKNNTNDKLTYRFGKSNHLELVHTTESEEFTNSKNTQEVKGHLQGIKNISFQRNDFKYVLEQQWSTENINNISFMSQLRVAKDNRNIVEEECIEHSVFY